MRACRRFAERLPRRSVLFVSVAVAPVGAPPERLPRRSVLYAVEAVRACRRFAIGSVALEDFPRVASCSRYSLEANAAKALRACRRFAERLPRRSVLFVSVAVAPVGAPPERLPRRSVLYAVEAVRACRRFAICATLSSYLCSK